MSRYRCITNLDLGRVDKRGRRIRHAAGTGIEIGDEELAQELLDAGAIEAAAPVEKPAQTPAEDTKTKGKAK